MLSNEALERVLGRLQSRFDEVNSFYIRKIAEQIKKIGRLSQANINRLVIMADMTSDVREITERLVTVTRLNAQDIQAVFNAAMQQTYSDPRFTQAFTAGAQPSAAVRQRPSRMSLTASGGNLPSAAYTQVPTMARTML